MDERWSREAGGARQGWAPRFHRADGWQHPKCVYSTLQQYGGVPGTQTQGCPVLGRKAQTDRRSAPKLVASGLSQVTAATGRVTEWTSRAGQGRQTGGLPSVTMGVS